MQHHSYLLAGAPSVWLTVDGPERTVQLFGIKMVGLNADNGIKLLLTVAALVLIWLLARGLKAVGRWTLRSRRNLQSRFWTEQGVHLFTTALTILLFVSIWF